MSFKKVLVLCEGTHTELKLLTYLNNQFPELNFSVIDRASLGSDIFELYSILVERFGEAWYTSDIDLPTLLSNVVSLHDGESKIITRLDTYTDIYLFFDFEGQDDKFDAEHLELLQSYFCDSTDHGQLLLSYPMIESYYHIHTIEDFSRSKYDYNSGIKYKTLVNTQTKYNATNQLRRVDYLYLLEQITVKTEYITGCTFEIYSFTTILQALLNQQLALFKASRCVYILSTSLLILHQFNLYFRYPVDSREEVCPSIAKTSFFTAN